MQLKLAVASIAVILIVVAISACVTTTRNEVQTQTTSYTATSIVGQPTVSVTATYLSSTSSLTTYYDIPIAAAPGNKFVTYAIYCQNINAKDMLMGHPSFLTLHDTEGNIYSYDLSTYNVKQQVSGRTLGGLTAQTNTQPGDTKSGIIVFQIPQSATPKSLMYDDWTNSITITL